MTNLAPASQPHRGNRRFSARPAFITNTVEQDPDDGTHVLPRMDTAMPDLSTDRDDDDFKVNLKGAGWIKCTDGTYIRDRGDSIYIKGYPASAAQLQAVAKLAQDKGWSKIALWDKGHNDIDQDMVQYAGALLARAGIACAGDKSECGSYRRAAKSGLDLWAATQRLRHLQPQ